MDCKVTHSNWLQHFFFPSPAAKQLLCTIMVLDTKYYPSSPQIKGEKTLSLIF